MSENRLAVGDTFAGSQWNGGGQLLVSHSRRLQEIKMRPFLLLLLLFLRESYVSAWRLGNDLKLCNSV